MTTTPRDGPNGWSPSLVVVFIAWMAKGRWSRYIRKICCPATVDRNWRDNSTISGTSQCHTANQPAPASVRLSFSFRQTTSGKIRIMIPTMNHDQQDCQFFLCAFSVPPVVKLHSKTAKRIVTSVCHWMSVEKQKRTGRSLARTGWWSIVLQTVYPILRWFLLVLAALPCRDGRWVSCCSMPHSGHRPERASNRILLNRFR